MAKAKVAAGFTSKIEVEARTLEEGFEAAGAGADIVMLDNMEPETLKAAAAELKAAHPHLIVEASGGITFDTMHEYFRWGRAQAHARDQIAPPYAPGHARSVDPSIALAHTNAPNLP